MFAGRLGDIDAAEHASDFLDSLITLQRRDLGVRGLRALYFLNLEVLLAERGDLRQVSHAEDLGVSTQRGELAPDDFRDGATDACIHFIKDHAAMTHCFGASLMVGEGDLHREGEAREFAA